MRTLIAIVLTILVVPDALACTCRRQTPEQARQRADLVFAGRVEEVVRIDGKGRYEPRIIVKFAVGRVWKGDVPAGFSMHTYQEFSTCRGFFGELARPGEELLVYAYKARAADWKENRSAAGAPNANSYTRMDSREKTEILRRDLVDALADDATIYSTNICSGTARWEDAGLAVRDYDVFRIPKGAPAMRDAPPFDEAQLPSELRALPQVCWQLRMARKWRVLEGPPANGADFEHELRATAAYRNAMTGSVGQAKDHWWRDDATGAIGLCRLMHPSPRKCGALAAQFETQKVTLAESDPCESGPL